MLLILGYICVGFVFSTRIKIQSTKLSLALMKIVIFARSFEAPCVPACLDMFTRIYFPVFKIHAQIYFPQSFDDITRLSIVTRVCMLSVPETFITEEDM